MPDLMSAALFERGDRVLVVHRRRPPFASQWTLPMIVVAEDEAAEDALRRHARDQFGVTFGDESFVETVYIVDPDDQRQYVANIFRTPMSDGGMRFNAEGDYDDARWLVAAELADLWMPPDLRLPLIKILTDPESLHETDWSQLSSEGTPIAERAEEQQPPPDNRAAWDAIADAYQAERYGDRDVGRLKWSYGIHEVELQLLDDVRGKRALVLGCGGGQDVVALSRMGAVAVGIDLSEKQIEYARKYAGRHDATNASFVQGTVEDLSRFDDQSFDLALSIHALDYVEQIERTIVETARVLKPAGVLAIAVVHPLKTTRSSDPTFALARSYWSAPVDWEWSFENGTRGRLRWFPRTVSTWFTLLADNGFAVERLAEPYQGDVTGDDAGGLNVQLAKLIPYVLIFKARKR